MNARQFALALRVVYHGIFFGRRTGAGGDRNRGDEKYPNEWARCIAARPFLLGHVSDVSRLLKLGLAMYFRNSCSSPASKGPRSLGSCYTVGFGGIS